MKKALATTPVLPPISASCAARRHSCPGSGHAEAQYGESENEYSQEGTLLHRAYMRPDTDPVRMEIIAGLNEEQVSTLLFAEDMTYDFIREFRAARGISEDEPFQTLHEESLIFRGIDGDKLSFPGHADLIVNWPRLSCRVIADAKFGFMSVEEAPDNVQLATYACQSYQRAPASYTGVGIFQPRNFGPRKSTAVYSQTEIEKATDWLRGVYAATIPINAPRHAGSHCHFCKAKATCDTFQAGFQPLAVKLETAVETLTDDRLITLHKICRRAAQLAKEVSGEMRARIEKGELPGWKLKNTGDTREVNDRAGMYAAFKTYFADTANPLSPADYDACLDVQWGLLEKLVKKLTGLPEKKAKELVKEISAPFVTATPKDKSPTEEK